MSRTLQWCNWRQKSRFFLQLKVCILFLLCSILCFLLSFCFSASYKIFQIIRWAYKNIKKAYYSRKYFNLKKNIMNGMSSNRSQIYFELTKVLKTSFEHFKSTKMKRVVMIRLCMRSFSFSIIWFPHKYTISSQLHIVADSTYCLHLLVDRPIMSTIGYAFHKKT